MEMESLLFSNWLRNIEVFLLLCLMPHLELCGVFVCLLFFSAVYYLFILYFWYELEILQKSF